jgi:pimeloyl-ACP methyl ester carboxylesterase
MEPSFEADAASGIERVICRPGVRKHATPILLLHGMWHGAWCWRDWQVLLAERGWDSTAISLPGHGASPALGPISGMTMTDYLAVVSAEIDRMPQRPVVIGHSMGGALAQWYLARVADDLPAVVMLASWTAQSTIADGTRLHLKRDLWGFLKSGFTHSVQPLVRDPRWTASLLLGPKAAITGEELHARLCEESYLVLGEHNPPKWKPKPNVASPMLWVAAERDAVISLEGARHSAEFYGAGFISIPNAGHDLMFDRDSSETLALIDAWLRREGL